MLLLGGSEGEGDMASCSGLGGEPPPLPPVPQTAGSGGSGGFGGGLEGGIADRLSLRVGVMGVSWMGLRSAGRSGSSGDAVGADGALVLGGRAVLRQSCSGSLVGVLGLGEPRRGIREAIRRISSLTRCSSSSTFFIFIWWSAAHSSMLPWKVARCWLGAVFTLFRKARASFTLVSCVGWYICLWLSSLVSSRMACQMLLRERLVGVRCICQLAAYPYFCDFFLSVYSVIYIAGTFRQYLIGFFNLLHP